MSKLLVSLWTRVSYTVGRMVRESGLALERHGSRLEKDIACFEPLSRHRNVMPIYDMIPTFHRSAFIAPNSSLIGSVYLGQNTSVGYSSTLRADRRPIRIGANSVIGDKVAITNVATLGAGIPTSTTIGNGVLVESGSVLQSCVIDDEATVGHSSIVLEGVVIERGAVIAPNSLVPAGRLIPAYQLWAGNPVRFVKDLTEEEKVANIEQTAAQVSLSATHKETLIESAAYDKLLA